MNIQELGLKELGMRIDTTCRILDRLDEIGKELCDFYEMAEKLPDGEDVPLEWTAKLKVLEQEIPKLKAELEESRKRGA